MSPNNPNGPNDLTNSVRAQCEVRTARHGPNRSERFRTVRTVRNDPNDPNNPNGPNGPNSPNDPNDPNDPRPIVTAHMGFVGLFYPWGLILQAVSIVHFVHRRPDTFWLWIIIIGGPLGALVYIAAEVIPDAGLLPNVSTRLSSR